MIDRFTVFILGAGANCDYYLPTARQLLKSVVAITKPRDDKDYHGKPLINDIVRTLRLCEFEDNLIYDFSVNLEQSGASSVDSFLEKERNEKYRDLGKHAIASSLIPRENKNHIRIDLDKYRWYEYLFEKMQEESTVENFINNRAFFITFNYDRSLEYFLYERLIRGLGATCEEAASIVKQMNIIHLYGSLGLPHFISLLKNYKTNDYLRDYTPEINHKILKECANSIKILDEATNISAEFDDAKSLIEKAEIICFLGFGYHKENIRRLRIDELKGNKKIIGSAFKLVKGQQESIKRDNFPNQTITFGEFEHANLPFLKYYSVI